MTNVRRRTRVRTVTVDVTGVAPARTAIIPEASGFAPGLVQLIASSQEAGVRGLTVYEESAQITPTVPLAASGTFVWDAPGGQLELTQGSGLYGSLDFSGTVEVTAYYVLHDERNPDFRGITYVPSVTRKPGHSGQQ